MIDGDTVVLEILGTVRLIGIDTPESVDPRMPVQAFAREAAAYTTRHVQGARVRLEYDYPRRDRYGRTLAYLYLMDGTFFNAQIVKEGYAFAYVKYPFKYLEAFIHYQREARERGLGLWAEGSVGVQVPDYVLPNRLVPTNIVVAITELTNPVSAGQRVRLVAETDPGVLCEIQVIYQSGPSDSPDLLATRADGRGRVIWEWDIGTRTRPGEWPVQVSCNEGLSAQGTLNVQ